LQAELKLKEQSGSKDKFLKKTDKKKQITFILKIDIKLIKAFL
jgi:hypothetical protein